MGSERISAEDLDRLEHWARWGVEFANKSREMAASTEVGSLHVGVVGVVAPTVEALMLDGLVSIRPVVAPPGLVHIAPKVHTANVDYLAVARHATHINCEIAFFNRPEHPFTVEVQHSCCWHLIALLKIRGHQVYCPASSSQPWDLIAGAPDRSVEMRLLDDKPARISLRPPTPISAGDIQWIDRHYMTAFGLRSINVSRRFGLAFNLAYRWNLTDDYRVGLTLLWAGLEALFGDQNDHPVTSTLATRISGWLPSTSDAHVRRLYRTRCDAVHGRDLDASLSSQVMLETERLLQDALIVAIERNRVPLPDW